MPVRKQPVVVKALGILAALTTVSGATIIAEDDFSYSNGAIDGENGGSGWAGAWFNAFGSLTVTGGEIAHTNSGVGDGSYRELTTVINTANLPGGELWMGFDGNVTLSGGFGFVGISPFIGTTTEPGLIGATNGRDTWGMGSGNAINGVAGGLVHVVIRFDLVTNDWEMWTGTAGGTVDVSGTPTVTHNADIKGTDTLRLAVHTGTLQLDNLVLATTPGEVGGSVPEPSISVPSTMTINSAGIATSLGIPVTNGGVSNSLTVSGAVPKGRDPDAGFFTVPGDQFPLVVAPGATVDLTVNFDPGSYTGPLVASLDITSDAVNEPTATVNFDGMVSDLTLPAGPYAVAASPWDLDQRGSHRAVVSVTQSVDAVKADLPWRRRDSNPQDKNIVVVDATTGTVVSNRIAVDVTSETGTVVFQPQTVPGDYHIYYLPHTDSQNIGSYGGGYVSFQDTAASGWLSTNNLPADADAKPAASFQTFESRLPIDSFWPMEVPLTTAELSVLQGSHPDPFLLFAEDGLHPIKMRDELPYRWNAGPSTSFSGTALADESYAFQLGLFASTQAINDVLLSFTDLSPTGGGSSIPASAFSCINLGGTNWDGEALIKMVDVSHGEVQPLWITLQVPAGIAPGDYTGQITVDPANAPAQNVDVTLTIGSGAAVNHGFDTPENHSRLAWLDSQFGVSDVPIAPYTPMTLNTRTVGVLGRSLTFDDFGMPAAITADTTGILSAPARLDVTAAGSPLIFSGGVPSVTLANDGAVEWESTATSGGITMHTRARMEFDGHVNYKIGLSSASTTSLDNIALEIPLTAAASEMMAGMGEDGGLRPSSFSWSWSGPWDSLWLGSVKAGLHCELRGGSYHGPLLNLYNPADPPTWGGGSVTVQDDGAGALLRATTGSEQLTGGVETVIEFSLLITPVKPVDHAKHFATRYYHNAPDPDPPSDWQDWGVNVINVHHSNSPNPFINWPFATPADTTGFIDTYHAQGAKVKLYNTIRELTQYTAEIWALRSLDNEVLAGGGGGGFPWLREHFINDYSTAWYMPVTDGRYDAATVTTRDSRWYNYYVEGIRWLADNYEFDGLYLDDVAFDRRTVKRIRRALLDSRPDSRIDLHSNTGFSHGPINQYADFLPYLDRLWFGESWNYNGLSADEWLVQVSGIPFGLMGELLHAGGNQWLGSVFGMTQRWGWTTNGVFLDPRPVWKIWDGFGGLHNADMIGWWDDNPPVTASHSDVKVTSFVKNGRTMIAVGNFSTSDRDVTLSVDWTALGLDPAQADFFAPSSSGFQSQAVYQPGDTITVEGKRAWLFIIDEEDNLAATRQLLAHYRLSEGSGTTAIDELGGYDGTYVGAVTHESDESDPLPAAEGSLRSVELSGGEWVELPAALADAAFRSGEPWTISFWVRPTLPSNSLNATFTWMNTSGDAKGILFHLQDNGSLDYWLGDGNTWNGGPNYDPDPGTDLQEAWVHVAASLDGTTLRCYHNGSRAITPTVSTFQLPDAGRPITLGLRPDASPGSDLRGRLSDVRIYRGALSDQDVQDLYTYPGWPVPADTVVTGSANNPFHTVSMSPTPGGDVALSVPAVAGWIYQYQYSPDLVTWFPLGAPLTAPPAGLSIDAVDPQPLPDRRFYRVFITK